MKGDLVIRSIVSVTAALIGALVVANGAFGQIGFADHQTDRIQIFNSGYYDVAFRKQDGRILYLYDKTTNQEVSPGNVFGPWVLRFSNNTWLDGANFSPSNPSRTFSYAWNSQTETLTLSYVATGSQACTVTIEVKPTNGPEVDTRLSILNQSGLTVELLAYPVQLSFRRSQIDGVYVPYLEGMKLLPSFFTSLEFGSGYPGQMFADFAYTDLSVGSFAVYMVHDLQQPLKTAQWLILRDDTYAGGVHKYHHDFTVAIGDGQQWTSPKTVLSIGSTLDEAMAAYWTRSGHDAMPTLLEKLGAPLFEKLAGALLLKRDFLQGPWTFSAFQDFLSDLPGGSLLHFVAFWPNGFDENYPDYLPPHPALGSQTELQNLVSSARASGHLVMPYTNPTWWDDQSPTLASLGTGIVSLNRSGGLISEVYGASHGGYVVCPYSLDVIARQDQTRNEFTQTVPCDLLFEDQIGARAQPKFDGNPAAPDPTLYTQGLIDVAERSASYLPIMSEGGFDRLGWYESGFCNSHTIGWHNYPSDTYQSYPMATLWAHEHMYFSAHNLAGNVMTVDLPLLTYYVSVSYSLSFDLSMNDLDWVNVIDHYQKHFVSKLLGQDMVSFDLLTPDGHTRTLFEDGTEITANLTTSARAIGDHMMAANGFAAIKNGEVLAGVFSALNGQALSGDNPHYLILDRQPQRTLIYQPRGDDGAITLTRPSGWSDDSRIALLAIKRPNVQFARSVTIQASTLTFDYVQSISGQDIDYFKLIYCTDTDVDCDGDTDLADFDVLVDCMSGPGSSPNPTPPRTPADCLNAFDQDADSDIDLADFRLFLDGYTGG